MRVTNDSAVYTSAQLRPLIEFAGQFLRKPQKVALRLVDADEDSAQETCSGYAWKVRPNAKKLRVVAGPFVVLVLSRNRSYPCRTTYVKEVGPVRLRSWEEEFVFVLGHEFGHLNDFEQGGNWTIEEEEIRAERFGILTLEEFKASS